MSIFLILSFFIPPLGLPLGLYGLYKDFAHWRKYVFCLALAIFAFSYVHPVLTDWDLSRYCESLDTLRQMSFFETFEVGFRPGTPAYGFALWEWIVSQTGDYHLCWSVLVSLVYLISFYVTCRVGTDYNINKFVVFIFLCFQISCLNFVYVTAACRNFIAFYLIGLAVFRDLYQKKHDLLTLILYVVPCFFHQTALILILPRLFVCIVKRGMIIFLPMAFLVKPCVDFLYLQCFSLLNIDFAGNFIQKIISHAYGYLNNFVALDFAKGVAESPLWFLYKWSCVLLAVVSCICILYIVRNRTILNNKEGNSIGDFLVWVYSVALLVFVGAQMATPEYERFCNVLIGFMAPVYFLFVSIPHNANRMWINVIMLCPLVSILCWIPGLYRHAFEMFINSFFTSPLLIAVFDIFDIEFFESLCGIFS